MPEPSPDNVWGGATAKEQRLKDYVNHQDREATRTREATEAMAQQAAAHAAIQAEAMGHMLAAQQGLQQEANLKRVTPEILFHVIQARTVILKNLPKILKALQGAVQEIPAEQSEVLLTFQENFRGYANTVFSIDSTYLSDFEHKQSLQELRAELHPIIKQWNQVCHTNITLRNLQIPQIVSERYSLAMKFTKKQIDNYFSKHQQALLEQQAVDSVLNQQLNEYQMFVIGGVISIFLGIIWAFLMPEIEDKSAAFCIWITPPLVVGYASLYIWNACHDPSEEQATLAAIIQELSAIHPPEDIGSFETIRDEMNWKGDSWILNQKGKKAVDLEIDKFWRIDIPT